MARIFSGIQPTGELHIGSYLGAIRHWAREQDEGSLFCLVDLHALTVDQDPDELRARTIELAAGLLACGLDPAVCTLFVQSHVAEHTQLSWLLECTATYGELQRMTQFKEKAARREVVRGGLLTYPVLMAADILLYDTDLVPVGDDQRQHLELARELAERFNNRFGPTFVVPDALVSKVAARVMDLQEPANKMSKSEVSPQGTVGLFDTPDVMARKVRRAVTDADGEVRFDRAAKPGVSNLLEILSALTGTEPHELAARYDAYRPLKDDVAEALIAEVAPIAARRAELLEDPDGIRATLAEGAARARGMAATTYARAAEAMGLLAP
ncbi:MAG TPA: tryptophan--tRNA ligase [Acidimicrobiales bacterium]|nr:tryptophan--tRNA ligase [Acidimicrobiales bacterium]